MVDKIIKYQCKKCGKIIKSLYQKQMDYWIRQHNMIHDDEGKQNNN